MNESELFKSTKQRELHGAYLLHGAEELTKQEAVERIKEVLDPSFRDLNMDTLKMPTAQSLLSACDQLPFFDEKRLVMVKDWDATQLEACLDKLDSLPSSTILLFVRRGDEKSTTALYSRLDKQNRVVEFPKLTEDRAISMVLRESALMGCSIDRVVARQLIMMVGTDAYRLRNELSKAAGYVGTGNTITEAALKIAATPSVEYNVFNLLNYLLAGNKRAGLRLMKEMIQDGQSALQIAYFLEGRLRLMLHAKELLATKTPQKDAIKQLGGNPKAAEIALKNANKQDYNKLCAAVRSLAEVDIKLKQGAMRDEEALTLAICRCF
ncbi:MAG: DNA polymerase III subunit delta [Eubacteriales bacterium]|nr:DNA polymerase III subunit delta [Eubacteriales bacterium]